jgi:hypothetical protein
MAKPKPKGSRRILRKVGIALGGLVLFLLLFVAAFVFNPFEGAAGELRDVVPRGVNFFVRKQRLADDFAEFPKPRFWDGLAELRGFAALADGELGKAWERAGITRLCEQAAAEVARVRADSVTRCSSRATSRTTRSSRRGRWPSRSGAPTCG